MSVEENVKNLAIAAAKKILATAEGAEKNQLQSKPTRGTVYAYDGEQVELGYASVPKPAQPKPMVEIEDEDRVLPWAVDMFGESAAAFRLSKQGRTSVIEYALAQHSAAGSPAEFGASTACSFMSRRRGPQRHGSPPQRT